MKKCRTCNQEFTNPGNTCSTCMLDLFTNLCKAAIKLDPSWDISVYSIKDIDALGTDVQMLESRVKNKTE